MATIWLEIRLPGCDFSQSMFSSTPFFHSAPFRLMITLLKNALAAQPLLRIILLSMAALLMVMLIVSNFDWVNVTKVEAWLHEAQTISTPVLVAVIMGLLLVDFLLSIPTLLIAVLSGFFLGAVGGALTVFCGLFGTVSMGYFLGKHFGDRLLNRFCRSPEQRNLLALQYQQHSSLLIVFARAVPMLPEITAVLSGSHNMPYWKFFAWWALGTAPYCIIASYSGSVSSASNPTPALAGMLALMAGLWILAAGLKWHLNKKVI